MRPTSALLVFLLSCTLISFAADIPPNDVFSQGKDQQFYPWSDASEYVRVPKRFLGEIRIFGVTMTNTDSRLYVLSDDFARTFKLTAEEIERVNKAIGDALHEYRMTQAKFLEPTEDEPDNVMFRRGRPEPVEKFIFKLTPFPEESMAIRQKLEESVLSALGEQRSKFFWQTPGLLDSEMKSFDRESPLPPGMIRSTLIVFELPQERSRVDLYRYDITRRTDGGRGGGGGASGSTLGEFLDQYAPEPMKPVLAKWRTMIAETSTKRNRTTGTNGAENLQPTPVPPATIPSGLSRAAVADAAENPAIKWDDKSPFADLPKDLLKSLHIPGLTLNGDISPEAIAFFGLTPDDQSSVQELYTTMKARFEKLEREHFARTDPGQNSFILKAFPEKSAALKDEWAKKLATLVGEQRSQLLDRSIRTDPNPFQMMRRNPRLERGGFRSPADLGPGWLHRGANEARISITIGPGRDGQQTILQLDWQTDGGARGSGGVPGGQIPERWRHLITPDMLGLPLPLF